MSEVYGARDLKRCLLISAVVGTVLVSINQGPAFFLAPQADLAHLGRAGLNYVVPFTVASVSAWMANRAHRRERAGPRLD
ncbi:MAG: nitrate/nitrite transporter NrtS [Thermoplasmata archaeon]